MAWWITVYCRRPRAGLEAAALLRGLRAGDPTAPAGVDYLSLAEDYDVPASAVAPAVAQLHVSDDLEIGYDPQARPVVVHLWTAPHRVREEVEEAHEVRGAPSGAHPFLDDCTSVVGIELGATMAQTMSVAFAYEAARYIAQRYDGVIVDDDDRWQRVMNGAFLPLDE